MAKTKPHQTSFTSGVLNRGLIGRTDIEHYYQGLLTGHNILCKKEGGIKAAWGLTHVDDAVGNARIESLDFDSDNKYVLVFSESKLEIWKDDVKETNINGGGLDYIATPWTLAQALVMGVSAKADTMILTHEDVEPRTLLRGTAAGVWTLATLSTNNLPQYDFNDASSPTPTSHTVSVVFTGIDVREHYTLELNGYETPSIVYTTDTSATERRIRDELLALPDTGYAESSITVAHQSGTTYLITFSGESADAYEDMTGFPVDDATATIACTTTQTGVARREDVISATRGWPAVSRFVDSRLLLGGLKALPKAIIGTRTGMFNPYDFKLASGDDSDGIFIQLDAPGVVRAIFDGRDPQIFTSKGEHYIPDDTLTPAPATPRQSKYGIAAGIPPVEVDGATIYVANKSKTLREYLYQWDEEAYAANSLTILSSDLFDSIASMDAQTSTSDDEESHVIAVNGDGTVCVLNTLRSQDIAAWTTFGVRSGDSIKQVTVCGDSIYFLVERTRNSATVYTLEKADTTTRLEAQKKVTTGLSTSMSGFTHLAGETATILVDGAPRGTVEVSTGGVITLDTAPTTSLEAGYFVSPVIKPMPLMVDMGRGPELGAKKRIIEVRLLVEDTLGLVINGYAVQDHIMGSVDTLTELTPYTGLVVSKDAGWTDGEATVTITQTEPLPLDILSMATLLDVGHT